MMYDTDVDPFVVAMLLVLVAVAITSSILFFDCRGVSAEDHSDNVRLTQRYYEPRYVQLDEHQFQRLIEALEKGDSK